MGVRSLLGVTLTAVLLTGCGSHRATGVEELRGRRVQAAAVAVHHDGGSGVEAHEIHFASVDARTSQARRAGFVLDLVHGEGTVRGFVEWGPEHGPAVVYRASGNAKRHIDDSARSTVLTIVLDPTYDDHVRRRRASFPSVIGLRIVIDERTGTVTATRRL